MSALPLPRAEREDLRVPRADQRASPEDWQVSSPRPHLAPAPTAGRRERPLPRVTRAQGQRRRRLTILVAWSVLGLVVVAGGRAVLDRPPGPSSDPVPISVVSEGVYVVQPGDTLWSIARRLASDGDLRPVVAELRARHGQVDLEVGDRLDVSGLP
jgi:nucleoid-associated protein YgaU